MRDYASKFGGLYSAEPIRRRENPQNKLILETSLKAWYGSRAFWKLRFRDSRDKPTFRQNTSRRTLDRITSLDRTTTLYIDGLLNYVYLFISLTIFR